MSVPAIINAVSFPAVNSSPILAEVQGPLKYILLVVIVVASIVVVIASANIILEQRRKRARKLRVLTPGIVGKKGGRPGAIRSELFKEYLRPVPVTNIEAHHFGIPAYDAFYMPRVAEEEKIIDVLNSGFSVVLSGKSGVGKSRAIFEILSRHDEFKSFTLLRPAGPITEPILSEMYIPGNKYVLLLDELDVFTDMTGAVKRMVEVVREASVQLFVFATVRKDSESDLKYVEAVSRPELWEGFKEIELPTFTPQEIAEIIETCETDIKQNEFVDETPLTALLSFESLKAEYKSLGDLDRPEGLRTILQALKTLRMLGQTPDIVAVKKLCNATVEQSQAIDEEIAQLAQSGFFEVVDKHIVCHERVLEDILGADLPLEENGLKQLIADGKPMRLWWAGAALYKNEKYYKSLRCFEEIESKYWTGEHVTAYLSSLRAKLNIVVEEEVVAPVAPDDGRTAAEGSEPLMGDKDELTILDDEKASEILDEQIQSDQIKVAPVDEEIAEEEQPRERRRAKIELQRDKETISFIENWRKEINHQIETRNYSGAIQNLHRLLATDYNDAETHLALGFVYARVNNAQRADYHLRKGVYLDKTNPVAHSKYAHFMESLGKINPALNEYFIAGMLEVIKGDVRLESFGKCNELSRKVHNPYINYLAAAFYTSILYCLGERGDALEFLDMIEAGYGQYPIVDYLIDALRGEQREPLQGDELEAHAANRIAQLVAAEKAKVIRTPVH